MQLVGYCLGGFDVGIEDCIVKIVVFDKGFGVDIDGGYCFGLVDDQIVFGFEFDFMFQCVLNFVFNVKEIEYWLMVVVVFQFVGYFWDIFGGEFE